VLTPNTRPLGYWIFSAAAAAQRFSSPELESGRFQMADVLFRIRLLFVLFLFGLVQLFDHKDPR
jgi:hypothetical protein